jgi:molybdopterin synthase catalytic subunit
MIQVQKYSGNILDKPIGTDYIGEVITSLTVSVEIGGYSIFVGQVRADVIDGKKICAVEYSADEEMFAIEIGRTYQYIDNKFKGIHYVHVAHTKGRVNAGEISLFVLVAAIHKEQACKACEELVDNVKYTLPIFRKQIFDDGSSNWK